MTFQQQNFEESPKVGKKSKSQHISLYSKYQWLRQKQLQFYSDQSPQNTINMSKILQASGVSQIKNTNQQLKRTSQSLDPTAIQKFEQFQKGHCSYQSKDHLQIEHDSCLPLSIIGQISINNIKLQKKLFLSKNQRQWYAVQQKARSFLIEQSQSEHKITLPSQYLKGKKSQLYKSNKIEGFHQDDSSRPRSLDDQQEYTQKQNFKPNYQKNNLQVIKNKRRSFLLQRPSDSPPKQRKKQKVSVSDNLAKNLMCKISVLKVNYFESGNTYFISKKMSNLQERTSKERLNYQNLAYKKKQAQKDCSQSSLIKTQKILKVTSQKSANSSQKVYSLSQASQKAALKPYLDQKIMNTQSQIFQPLNPQLKSKSKRGLSCDRNDKSSNAKRQQKIQNQQAFRNLLKTLQNIRIKDNKNKKLIDYHKIQRHNQILHSMHNGAINRQAAAMNFHWDKQKIKKRNSWIKNQTLDIFKLSLIEQKIRKDLPNTTNDKQISRLNARLKIEPQSCWKLINPIFITQK